MKFLQHGSLWLAAAASPLVLVACVDRNGYAGPGLTGPAVTAPPAEPVRCRPWTAAWRCARCW